MKLIKKQIKNFLNFLKSKKKEILFTFFSARLYVQSYVSTSNNLKIYETQVRRTYPIA